VIEEPYESIVKCVGNLVFSGPYTHGIKYQRQSFILHDPFQLGKQAMEVQEMMKSDRDDDAVETFFFKGESIGF
jgi:hypothetical protein